MDHDKNDFAFQLILPTAFDEAGIRMLDSVREIFEILTFEFESVAFDFVQYKNFEELTDAIEKGFCPVVDVLKNTCIPQNLYPQRRMARMS